jgi:hypothetical protein
MTVSAAAAMNSVLTPVRLPVRRVRPEHLPGLPVVPVSTTAGVAIPKTSATPQPFS